MAEKKTVLVVEDNEIDRMMLCSILEDDYRVLEAENGQQALDVLAEHQDEVALALLDIVMPVMDGYTFLSILRQDPERGSLPVIVTTQSDGESDELAALSHGATDFVSKPYRAQIILHRVHSLITLRENAAMAWQFRFDRLTGLYTQEYFYQRVREQLNRQQEEKFDILCSDIENFKLFNDLFGTDFGDSLLQAIAGALREQVGERGASARFYADQFVCLTTRDQPCEERFQAVERAVAAVSHGRTVVLKWGVYHVEDKSLPVDQMCDRAMLAVRQIKGRYGRQYNVYNEALRLRLLREQAISDCMETALAGGQFLVYYQPKYRLRDSRLCGAEALVRWKHPEWGFQSPGEFISLFERNGFITELDRFVWECSCRDLHRWDQMGLKHFPVSVNVSRMDIYNVDLPNLLCGLIQKYDLEPRWLHLEITESAYTENTDQIIEVVAHLRELGFIIELDDFGSGYSSLSMISELPIDILKLDMRLVQRQAVQPENLGIMYFIMDLARWMNLETVAEGVETSEQIQRLRDAGCDIVQGYYLSKPMPVEEFEALAARQLSPQGESPVPPPVPSSGSALLCADEDPKIRALVREIFSRDFQILEASDKETAVARINGHRDEIAAAIVSLTMPGPADLSIFDILKGCCVPIIATAAQNNPWEEVALEQGAWDFLRRPYSPGSLRLRVLGAISNAETQSREGVLRREAYQDPLTGLLNRRGLQMTMAGLERENTPFAVYMLDLDHLKEVNDNHGHQEGDRFIRRFADHLKHCTRQTDIVGRYGGDEFAVVLLHIDSVDQALRRGQELCGAAARARGERNTVSATGGLALCHPGETIEEMIRRADAALYRAKESNRGSCCA